MGVWCEGIYNANYILNQSGLIKQIKFETTAKLARLDEISIEKYNNGKVRLLFTIHPNASKANNQGSNRVAKLAYNSLLKDLQERYNSEHINFSSDNDEVHSICCCPGHERLLLQVLARLEEYDPSLSEIMLQLEKATQMDPASKAQIEAAISNHKQRLELLNRIASQSNVLKKYNRKPSSKSLSSKSRVRSKARSKAASRRRA